MIVVILFACLLVALQTIQYWGKYIIPAMIVLFVGIIPGLIILGFAFLAFGPWAFLIVPVGFVLFSMVMKPKTKSPEQLDREFVRWRSEREQRFNNWVNSR